MKKLYYICGGGAYGTDYERPRDGLRALRQPGLFWPADSAWHIDLARELHSHA